MESKYLLMTQQIVSTEAFFTSETKSRSKLVSENTIRPILVTTFFTLPFESKQLFCVKPSRFKSFFFCSSETSFQVTLYRLWWFSTQYSLVAFPHASPSEGRNLLQLQNANAFATFVTKFLRRLSCSLTFGYWHSM